MPFAFRSQRRSGLTLVEILIALTMTLIVLGTMMTAFKFASEEMRNGRALIELANRARVVDDHLRTDLGSLTVEPRVYDETVEPHGYFEYVEGPNRDWTFAAGQNNLQGDCDDVLAFTARSTDGILYRGRLKSGGTTNIIESSLAEIVWFTTVNDNELGLLETQEIDATAPETSTVDFDDSIRIHRRVLLIRPDLNDNTTGVLVPGLNSVQANNFIRNNDISVRLVPVNDLPFDSPSAMFDIVANSLDDLAIRANRFAHEPTSFNGASGGNFPNNLTFELIRNRIASDDDVNTDYAVGASTQAWQALPPILSDVAAFDLRVYSPTASVNDVASVIVEPSDLGYSDTAANLQQLGAYVDLGYTRITTPIPTGRQDEWFIANSAAPTNPPNTGVAWNGNVWDSWTPAYESDGIDQNGDGTNVDEATNGIDNGGSNVIDDPGERETRPPYVEPIRGMKVTLRLVEKGTKQVHQVSIIQSFVPE